jgi:hypothetical protein
MPFRRARAAYLAAGLFKNAKAFDAAFTKVAGEVGVDKAIDRVLANVPKPKCQRTGEALTEPKSVPPRRQVDKDVCPRCLGEHFLPHFSHVEGGICFLCCNKNR